MGFRVVKKGDDWAETAGYHNSIDGALKYFIAKMGYKTSRRHLLAKWFSKDYAKEYDLVMNSKSGPYGENENFYLIEISEIDEPKCNEKLQKEEAKRKQIECLKKWEEIIKERTGSLLYDIRVDYVDLYFEDWNNPENPWKIQYKDTIKRFATPEEAVDAAIMLKHEYVENDKKGE